MEILVATNHLNSLGGSETFSYTLIEELLSRSNVNVEYFTFEKGYVSEKIEKELKVKCMSKSSYDLVLANHYPVVEELFGKGFIIQTCHGIFPKLERPNIKANAFVSISQEVQDHLTGFNCVSKIIYNGINLDRFKSKKPLNVKLRRVFSLCQSKEANEFIKKCCDSLSIDFSKANKNTDLVWEVSNLINEADLVVGLGRSAYEAMACGRPVIVYDNRSYFESCGDGYLRDILGFSLQKNCSGRYSLKKYDQDKFTKELQKYNCEDGQYFRNFAEKELDVRKTVDQYLSYYRCVDDFEKKEKKGKTKKKIKTLLKNLLGERVSNLILIRYLRMKKILR